jgi:hypothetical protein
MLMIELNFLRFIKSSCVITSCRYVLIKVNYFNRFVWIRFYARCNMVKSTNIMNNLIILIFEWSRILYSKNERHFTEYEFEELLKVREIVHFTASITHLSSVSLIERMIQLMIEKIRKRCIQRENSRTWALNVTNEIVVINTRKMQMHEHKSCDIMLRFISKVVHHDIKLIEQFIWKNEMKNLSKHDQKIMITLRAKNRFLTIKAMT